MTANRNMRKDILKKRTAILASTALAISTMLPAVPALAAYNYTPVAGTSMTFSKFLIMDAGDTVPNATFNFTVAPGKAISANTADNASMHVMAGVGTPTVSSVTFAPSDTTATVTTGKIDVTRTDAERKGSTAAATDEAPDTVQFNDGEKFAEKTATIDFSGIQFSEPGIYRYIITETANDDHTAAGIIHDTDTDRVLDVYVTHDPNGGGTEAVTEAWIYNGQEYTSEDDAKQAAEEAGGSADQIEHREAVPAVPGSGALVVSGYVLHTNVDNVAIGNSMGSADVSAAGAALNDKTDGFTNEYDSKDLKIEKEVAGNQGSRDKYFEFTVTCTDVADADSYVVSLADDSDANTNDGNADATSGAAKTGGTIAANADQTNPTTVTGAQLKAGQKFYLQHGQSVVIRGLAPNAKYAITENAEDYASESKYFVDEAKTVSTNGKTDDYNTLGAIAKDEKMVNTGFVNTRNGIIPTGIMLSVIPGIALILGAFLGIFAINKKRKSAA